MSPLTRSRVTLAVKVTTSVVLLVVLVAKAGLTHLAATLRTADPLWLLLGLALGVAAAGLQANQWRGLLLALGLRRSYRRCLWLDTAARVFDAALPSSIGGDVARVALVSDSPTDRGPAAMSVALRRIAQLPGLAALMAAGLAASSGLPYVGRIRPVALLALLGGAGLVAVTVLAGGVARSVTLPLRGVVRKLAGTWRAARAQATGQHRPFLRAGLRGLAFWLTVVLSQWCFMAAVHISVPVQYAALVVTTVNALSLLPVSLGGYGLREGAFSAFLAVGGLATPQQGVAVGVCLSAQTLAFGVAGGLVYLTVRRSSAPSPALLASKGSPDADPDGQPAPHLQPPRNPDRGAEPVPSAVRPGT